MNKLKMANGTVAPLDRRSGKAIEISWSPARAEEVRIQKSVTRNRMLPALGFAISMGTAVLVCGVTGCAGNRYEQGTGE